MDDIAAAAGVARQTVYAHYPSRRAVLAAVVDRLTAETAETLAAVDVEAGSASDALRAWLDASWGLIRRYPILLTPAFAAAAGDRDELEQHAPIMGTLQRLLE